MLPFAAKRRSKVDRGSHGYRITKLLVKYIKTFFEIYALITMLIGRHSLMKRIYSDIHFLRMLVSFLKYTALRRSKA